MSASVYSSTRLLLSPRNQDLSMFNRPEVRKVKRILFGPVDHQATQKFIDEELKKIIVTKSEQWNFDFKKERTLSPNGLFEWRPATPKKQSSPQKRKAESEVDFADQYFEFTSDANIVRPRPIKCVSPTHNGHKTQQQSRITDFMKATKRPLPTEVTKKQSSSEWNSDIPIKIPRLDIAS